MSRKPKTERSLLSSLGLAGVQCFLTALCIEIIGHHTF